VFVPGKPLQPSLMFAGKIRAYLSEAPFRVGPQPHPQTLDLAGKACQEETL